MASIVEAVTQCCGQRVVHGGCDGNTKRLWWRKLSRWEIFWVVLVSKLMNEVAVPDGPETPQPQWSLNKNSQMGGVFVMKGVFEGVWASSLEP